MPALLPSQVDEWLLKQAVGSTTQTSSTDLALAAGVFLLAFGSGLYFANAGSS